MAVKIIRPAERELLPVRPAAEPAGEASRASEHPIKRQVVSDDEPYAHIVEAPAHHVIAAHSHSRTEVTVILSGAAQVAGTTCGPGTVIVVPADEEYSIEVGDSPLTMVVMRPGRAAYRWAETGAA
jgi:mannose-6-phosphate isomerase-like protein (cupin superfamily)